MPSILVTPEAENDLVDIWLYIARNNEEAANRVYLAAEETFKTLIISPSMGTLYRPKRTKLRGVRFFPVSNFHNYPIYYHEHPEGITIIRVLHAHMRKHKRLESET
jgi:toxin ParE1/3/4